MAAQSKGELVISVLLRRLSARAASLSEEEAGLPPPMADQIRNLSQALRLVLPVAEVGEKQQADGRVRIWLEELGDVAYDADDLLDDLALPHPAGEEGTGSPPLRYWMRLASGCFLSCCDAEPVPVPFARRAAPRLEALVGRLVGVAEGWRNYFDLLEFAVGGGPEMAGARQETCSSMDVVLVGRKSEKERVMEELLKDVDRTRGASVISIVGMGGVGKTTLAQSVFNDQQVSAFFRHKMWVYVGENLDAKRVMQQMISGDMDKPIHSIYLDSLHSRLVNRLKNERFLIVLDDVWCSSDEEWDKLFHLFSHAASKVIVTTRSQKVANLFHPALSIPLLPLLDEDCWGIFEKYAFVNEGSDGYPALTEIGRSIVQRLNGVPLAAKVVGSLLANKLEEGEWERALHDAGSLLTQHLLPSLQRSYRQLPPHLKLCFNYCSIFPKGHKFERKGLVQMWMAEDFVEPVRHGRIEDIGNDYFDDLLQLFFFQYIDGYYVMPGLMHDLSQFNSTSECLRIADGESYGNQSVRHLSFSYNGLEHFDLQSSHKLKKLQTLIYLHELSSVLSNSVPCYLFYQLKCIRVLDLSYNAIKYLPDSVGKLNHLRYLDLSFTEIEMLPDSLCGLHNLQTLKLVEGRWHRLPEGMCNLINLRYLDADTELLAGVARIGKLTSLQELKVFDVYKQSGHRIGELKDMKEIAGSLCIRNLDNIESGVEAGQAKLIEKLRLVELKLEWDDNHDANPDEDKLNEEVLEGLQPPPYLKVLEIKFNKGVKYPCWMERSLLSTLTSISLYNCRKWETLPLLGELPCLRSLRIRGMHGVKQVGYEFYGKGLFPTLNKLEFEDMLEWEGWVILDKKQLFPSLKTLHIIKSPRLKNLPQLPPSLTELVIWEVGLHVIPEVQTNDELLSSMVIYGCPRLKSLPGGWQHFTKVDIRKCEELTSFNVHARPSFESLMIEECPNLTVQLPENFHLSSFECLSTDNIQLLTEVLPRASSCLKHLVIHDCSELMSFNVEELTLKNLTELEELYIWDCHNLHSLPVALGSLSSLVKLDIRGCPKIQCLPEKGLPSSLQHLHIGGCGSLGERCQVDMGSDWPKIVHIPFLRIIDSRRIMQEDKKEDLLLKEPTQKKPHLQIPGVSHEDIGAPKSLIPQT